VDAASDSEARAGRAPLWTWYDPAGIGAPVWFKFTPDGNLVISGRGTVGSISGYAKIDRHGGTIWTLPGVASLTRGDAAGDSLGNTYLIDGDNSTSGGSLLRKLAPSGALLWQRTQPLSAQRVEVAADGGAVIAGFPASGAGTAFMRYDADGDERWRNLDADGPDLLMLLHAQLLLDADDNAYLAAGTLFDMAVNRVDADGRTAWVALAPGSFAIAMALGSAGSVYVVGGNAAKFVYEGEPPPPSNADLRLALVDAPDPVRIGGTLTYTAQIGNAGPAAATDVRLTDVLPRTATLVSAVPTQGSCTRGVTVSCFLGTMAAGGNVTVTITVRPWRRGMLTNAATVTIAVADSDASNNSARASTQIIRR
jgi:uncharacterized repeat protein (TIGR01451 family)